jgi:hypothetical protein
MKRRLGVWLASIVLLSLAQTGCPGTLDKCCPTGVYATAQDPWICPANCPGGGKTRVDFEIKFQDDKENPEPCKPLSTFSLILKNLTDNTTVATLNLDNPSTGVYSGFLDITVTKDTQFEVIYQSDNNLCTGSYSDKFTVNVVDPCSAQTEEDKIAQQCDHEQICLVGTIDPPKCDFPGGNFPFGNGVLIDFIYNPESIRMRVKHENLQEYILPYRWGTKARGTEATGWWEYGFASSPSNDCRDAASGDSQQRCVDVYLQCNCP